MHRIPSPSEQAELLVSLLKPLGFTLGRQQSLGFIAKLAGYRNWNVMKAALTATPAAEPERPSALAVPKGLSALIDAAEKVVNMADDEGCSDDLTVTSASAVQSLRELLVELRRTGSLVPASARRQHSFSVGDVQSVRPDLTDDEAEEVLNLADRYFDASMGVNWDTLKAQADGAFPRRGVEARLVEQISQTLLSPVVIDYSSGTIYCCTLEAFRDVTARGFYEARRELTLERQIAGGKLSLKGIPVVYLPDGTFVDVEDDFSVDLFDGDTTALSNSISELRNAEQATGKTFIIEL